MTEPDRPALDAHSGSVDERVDASNLTRAQFLIWMGQRLYPESPLYNMVMTFTVTGELNPEAFDAAFEMLVERSDALRTVFLSGEGVPRRHVRSTMHGTLRHVDLSGASDPDAALREWVDENATRQFDLESCLFHSVLLKLAGDRWVWYLNKHHLITDGWSTAITYTRMQDLYELALRDRLNEAPTYPQFGDYVDYERARRESPSYKNAKAYWDEKAKSTRDTIDFYGKTALAAAATRTERVTFELGLERSEKLRQLATEKDIRTMSVDLSLFNMFSTVLFAYLSRITGRTDLAILAPAHNRPTQAFKQTIGLFIEVLPVHVTVAEDDTLQTLHRKVSEETMAFLMNAQSGTSSSAQNRAYSVLLNVINASFTSFAGLPMESDWVHPGHGDTSHSLRLQVHDFDGTGSIRLHFDMSCEVFDEERRGWVVRHFVRVLDAFIDARTQRLADIDLLSDKERQENLVRFNESNEPWPARTVVEAFETQVRRVPDAVALSLGDEDISYGQLDARANRLAHRLVRAGIGTDALVGILMRRSIEMVVSVLGVLKAGGAYVPIDPEYPEQRISFMLEDSGVNVLLTQEALRERLPDTSVAVICPESGTPSEMNEAEGAPAVAGPDDLAYVIYTSGSTGTPKGVAVAHGGLANYASWARKQYLNDEPADFAFHSSFSFDLTVTSIFVPLIAGGRVVIYAEEGKRDLAILDVFEDDVVDVVKLTPAHLSLIKNAGVQCRRIRTLIVGGEDLKTDLARAACDALGGNVTVYNEYGPTEATVGCMVHRFDAEADTLSSVPIGRPAANARIYVLDENLRPSPMGVAGEMHVAGAGVARGYLNRPELTAERFIGDPFRPAERMYRTGDLARWRGLGALEFLGRSDGQVKIRGARIELGEIEAAIAGNPKVRESVVSVTRMESSPRESTGEQRYCVRCGLSSNHPDAHLDGRDVCSVCHSYDAYGEEAERYFRSMDDLRAIFAEVTSGHRGKYDCLMLLSGGKDSTYALYQLADMGLNVLAFSLDNGYISDGAKANIQRAVDDLGFDLVLGSTPAMNAIFVDSLRKFSNVCQGCFKTIYTLGLNLAREHGIRCIVTGLSRGQIFETRLADLLRNQILEPDAMDRAIVDARKAYHRMNDMVAKTLDVEIFADDRIFDEVRVVDFYRYCDVELDEMLTFLDRRAPWVRPADTGRSTNCLINDTGILVHKRERGYHNYALPYSWDVRLGHKTRDAALEELNDEIDISQSREVLREIGYGDVPPAPEIASGPDARLTAYYVPDDAALTSTQLRADLAEYLPEFMIPSHFVPLESMPLTVHGKIDRDKLPDPFAARSDSRKSSRAPESQTEVRLAAIWSEVLGVDAVAAHDDFIELGGDSILNIQIVSRALKAGLKITPRQVFEHPTVAQLATVAEIVTGPSEQALVTGPVPLSPIQRWFFGLDLAAPARWNQAVELMARKPVEPGLLRNAFEIVLTHHDALRSSFVKDGAEWRQTVPEEIPVVRFEPWTETLEREPATLDLESGNLVRVQLSDAEATGTQRLRVEIHHLVIDAVSWAFLLEDLDSAYEQLALGEKPSLPPKTTSFQAWSRRLYQLARASTMLDELSFWTDAGTTPVNPLPVDGNGSNGDVETLSAALDVDETTELIRSVSPVFNTRIDDALLTALVDCLRQWAGGSSVRVNVERHGREEMLEDVDVSRTIGWFTSLHPVTLTWPDGAGSVDALKSVKEQLRRLPHHGLGYGVLRYLAGDAVTAQRLESLPPAEVLFNYLGRFDGAASGASMFEMVGPLALMRDEGEPRAHALEVNAHVDKGALRIDWTYSPGRHRRQTIETVANAFLDSLRLLIGDVRTARVGGYTPSDLPTAELTQEEIDDIMEEFSE